LRIIVLILITFLFLACNKVSNFNGTWVSCCTQGKSDSTLILTGIPPQKYISFDGENFEYGEYLNGSTFYHSSKYKIKKKRIYLDDDKEPWFDFRISKPNEMRYTNPNDVVFIYKRLNDSLKYKGTERFNLNDRNFKISKGKEIIDTAHFKNDSIVTWSSRLKNTGANKWIINDVSGFKLLSIQWLGQSTIYKEEKDRFFLKSFGKTPIDLIFEEIK
jgi:hypothetical protein